MLVESGARMHGSVRDEVIDRCTPSHLTVTAEAYLDPRSVAAPRRAALRAGGRRPLRDADLPARGPDRLRRRHARGRGAALLRRHDLDARPGEQLKPTVDLFSCPGIIYLVDPDRERLQADYDRMRELEADGVFELEELVAS